MEAFWWLLITGSGLVAYVAVLVRASMQGKQWATDTLRAIACMGDGSAAASALLIEEAARQRAAEKRRVRVLVA